jgi:predicted protein tyrosine phosphatase/5'-deoxynucleotidase YfbR-like HD superfamily hydrolase
MALPAWRAGTARPRGTMPSPSHSTACWWTGDRRASRAGLSREERLAALLHDAPEYVVGDMISPFKAALGLDYKAFEQRLLAAIHIRFGLPAVSPPSSRPSSRRLRPRGGLPRGDTACGLRNRRGDQFFGRPKGLDGENASRFFRLKPLATGAASAHYLRLFPETRAAAMIIVGPLSKVQPLVDEHGVRHVVTLLAPDTPHESPRGVDQERHLKLFFHDIVQHLDGHTPPTAADAEKMHRLLPVLAAREAPMLIHCWAGISRSTAAAYTALCMFRPKADEEELALGTPPRLALRHAEPAHRLAGG